MRQLYVSSVSAPSSSLLRFLKSQTESICFSTANSPSSPSRSCLQRPRKYSLHVCAINANGTRCLSTTRRWQATAQSSLLNISPSLHGPKQNQYFAQQLAPLRRIRAAVNHKLRECSSHQRYGSNTAQPFLQRLWPPRRDQAKTAEKSPDGLPLAGFHKGKASNDLKLRCTVFDENGKATFMNGEVKKAELIAKYGLLPRDLRKIDSSLVPHILVRPSAILINLLHLRVLIKHDRVLFFDTFGSTDSFTQSMFIYDLQGKLGQKETSRQAGGLPYEFRALESVLISVTSGLEVEFEGVRDPVVRVLKALEEDIDREKLRHLLIYSKKLGTFEQKARLVRDAIDDLLDADDDLAAMYLTERAQGKTRDEEDHNEVEMLLESYHKVCDEIVQASGNLVSNIRNTEEIVKAILDANRNSLMLLDLKFSIGTLGIGSGAFIAALYGMNLKNFLEDSDIGFFAVSGWSFVFAGIVCGYGLTKLRKLQRVTMWGEQGRNSRGSWRNVKPLPAPPGETGPEKLMRLKEAKLEAMRESHLGWDSLDAVVPAIKEKK